MDQETRTRFINYLFNSALDIARNTRANQERIALAKPKKPRKTPEQLEAEELIRRSHDLEAVNLQPDLAVLPSGSDIEVTRKAERRGAQVVEQNTARRLDAFEALKDGMVSGAYDAARRLERDILTRLGLGPHGQPTGERVDCAKGRVDAMMQAGIRCDEVQDRIPPRDWWLLLELIAPRIERPTWREAVAYITAELNPHAQGAVVRAACVNLRDAYTALERRAA